MKRIFLLRHAKAGFGTHDSVRPLNPRGQRDAFWLGQYLEKRNLLPDYVLCSSATRAKETFDQLQNGTAETLPVTFQDDLYLASAEYMIQKIQDLGPDIDAPMIIGHNPGLSILFQNMAHNPPKDKRSLKYPTCTVGILDFDIHDWSDLKSNMAQIVKLIIPSDKISPQEE